MTIARHPSETDERLVVRLLALALNAPASLDESPLELAKDMWEPDEPSLWQKNATGHVTHWIDLGQPDEKRLLRTSARVERLSVYNFHSNALTWWKDLENRLTRLRNLSVWQIPSKQSQGLAVLVQRTMALQITVQDGSVWVSDDTQSVEITLQRLRGPTEDQSTEPNRRGLRLRPHSTFDAQEVGLEHSPRIGRPTSCPTDRPGRQLPSLHSLRAHSLKRVEDLELNDCNPCRGMTCRWISIPEGLGRTFAKTGGKRSSNSIVRMARCRGSSVQSHHPA